MKKQYPIHVTVFGLLIILAIYLFKLFEKNNNYVWSLIIVLIVLILLGIKIFDRWFRPLRISDFVESTRIKVLEISEYNPPVWKVELEDGKKRWLSTMCDKNRPAWLKIGVTYIKQTVSDGESKVTYSRWEEK